MSAEVRTNPQEKQMSDESMLRTLTAQAEAIWPLEQPLLDRYELKPNASVLDIGCGPGEFSQRLLAAHEGVSLVGVDLDPHHLVRARKRCEPYGDRALFEVADALVLDLGEDRFDLTVCRHLLQAVPNAERVVEHMIRLTRPGGWLHLVAEDYAMMHFWPTAHDMDEFWRRGPIAFAQATGTDLRSGRKMFHVMQALGLADVRVDMLCIDTGTVDRDTFASIWEAWRDGYTDAIANNTDLDRAYVAECFEQMIECIRRPDGYAVWQLPVISGRVP